MTVLPHLPSDDIRQHADDGLLQTGDDQPFDQPARLDGNGHAPETNSASRRKTVLVVDDEPTVRLLITEVLHDLDHTCLEAVDGPSALTILKSSIPIDLLITDVGMPGGMDGKSLAAAARLERPGLAILFITGYAETAALGDAAPEPGIVVLGKPFSIDALATHIKDLTS